jgi:hypothetical protein
VRRSCGGQWRPWPRSRLVFRIREIEHNVVGRQPDTPCGGVRGLRNTAGALMSSPRRVSVRSSDERRSTGRWWPKRCPLCGNSTQETDVGQGVLALEPTTEEAWSRRRRCPGRESTCRYKPNTTHAPPRTRCPGTRLNARPSAMHSNAGGRTKTHEPEHAPLDTHR